MCIPLSLLCSVRPFCPLGARVFWSCSCIKSSYFHSIGQFLSFLSLKYPLHAKKRVKKRCITLQKLIFRGLNSVSRLMTRSKTLGSEHVEPKVDLILGNLSELNQSLLASTHSPSFLNLTPSGPNRSTPKSTQFWKILIESTHSLLGSTHFQFSFESFCRGSEHVDSIMGKTLFESTHSLCEFTHSLFYRNFALM